MKPNTDSLKRCLLSTYICLQWKKNKWSKRKDTNDPIELSFQICDREHKVFSVSIATENKSSGKCQ